MTSGAILTEPDTRGWPPVLWYAASAMRWAGMEVHDRPSPARDIIPDVVVAVGERCREACDRPGMFIAPDLADAELVRGFADNPGPLLLVGSLGFRGWSQSAAARIRHAEVLQLTSVDRGLEIPGDVIGSVALTGRVIERWLALLARLQ